MRIGGGSAARAGEVIAKATTRNTPIAKRWNMSGLPRGFPAVVAGVRAEQARGSDTRGRLLRRCRPLVVPLSIQSVEEALPLLGRARGREGDRFLQFDRFPDDVELAIGRDLADAG